jgi:integrase
MRGDGFIYKRGDVFWSYYKGERVSLDTRDEKTAQKLHQKRRDRYGRGLDISAKVERTGFEDLAALVERDYVTNGKRALKRVLRAIQNLREFFGNYRAKAIDYAAVQEYIAQRQADGMKPSTSNNELSALRRMFTLGTEAKLVDQRPIIHTLATNNARKGFLSPDQHAAIIRHLPDYAKAVAEFASLTGWRSSEINSRQWRHVDFEAETIRLDSGETENGTARVFPFAKYPALRELIHRQRETVREIEQRTGQIVPWVFVHENGSQVKSFKRAWKTARRAAGVPGALVHDYRRGTVRSMERAGVPRSTAMALVGHKTESIYRRYCIVDTDMLNEGVEKLAAFTGGTAVRGTVSQNQHNRPLKAVK